MASPIHSVHSSHSAPSLHSMHSGAGTPVPVASSRTSAASAASLVSAVRSRTSSSASSASSAITLPTPVLTGDSCVQKLWKTITAVFQRAMGSLQSTFRQLLAFFKGSPAPQPGQPVSVPAVPVMTLAQLASSFPAIQTSVGQLDIMQHMYACNESEETLRTTLTTAFETLSIPARRLLSQTHYDRHHEDATWVDSYTAGEDHFKANITSKEARETLLASLVQLPAYAIRLSQEAYHAAGASVQDQLVAISRLQELALPTDDWMLEVDPTTQDEINHEIAQLARGSGVNFGEADFEDEGSVTNEAHKAAIAAKVVEFAGQAQLDAQIAEHRAAMLIRA